jgi:N-acetylglutamate synthase-like GNAT family acetyltransferase
MELRKATRDDAQVILEIRRRAILQLCAGAYPDALIDVWAACTLSQDFAESVQRDFHVAVDHRQIVGTGALDPSSGRLDAIFVDPDYARSGIGRHIVFHLEEIARGHALDSVTLDSTLNAAPFYRSLGYEGVEQSTYYSPRGFSLPCIPMVKRLFNKTRGNSGD